LLIAEGVRINATWTEPCRKCCCVLNVVLGNSGGVGRPELRRFG